MKIGADDSAFVAALRNTQAQSAATAEAIQSSFAGVQATFSAVGAALAAFTAVLAGGTAFKEMIDATVQTNFAAQELGRQLGITATQAGVLRVAMDENFVTTEQVDTATAKIATTLRKNEEAFTRLGVATRDTNGEYRNSFDIMQDVNAALLNLKEGTDRNVEGQLIYGRGWAEVERTVLITKDSMAEAAKTADDLNLMVGQEGVAATNRYKKAIVAAGETVEGMKKTIGDALMPVLTSLAEWFRSIGPTAIDVIKKSIATLITTFSLLKNAVEICFDTIAGVIEETLVALWTFHDVLDRVLHFDFAGAKTAWTRGWDQMKDIANSRIDDIKRHAADFSSTAGDAFEASGKTPITPTKDHGGKASDYDDGKQAKRDAAAAKLLEREEKEQERSLEMAWERMRRLEAVEAEGQRDIALIDLQAEEEAAREKYAAHETHLDEYTQQLRAFEERKYAIQAKALADEIELANLDPTADPSKTAALYAQLEKAAAQHSLAMVKINSFAADEGRKQWKNLFSTISDAFAGSIQKMLLSTGSFAASLRGLFVSMTQAIAQAFVQMSAKNIATMLQQAAVGKGIRLQEIYGDAKKSASGAYSAVAGIPYVGPFLAPAAAAAAFAGTMAFASAEGGYDIPGGVNPVIQAHAREMVLPEKQADVIRGMADGGGGAGGHLELKLSPLRDGYFITKDNLVEHIKRAHRSFSVQGMGQ